MKAHADTPEVISSLMKVPSIGRLTAQMLLNEGYGDLKGIEEVGVEGIRRIDGIGEKKSKDILDDIRKGAKNTCPVSEFLCPYCKNIVGLPCDTCPECGKHFLPINEWILLPRGVVVQEPLKSLAYIDTKITEGRDDEETWYARGSILESMGAHGGARESYERVVEMNPHYTPIWNTKARLEAKIGLTDEAAESYRRSIQMVSGSIPPPPMVEDKEERGYEKKEDYVEEELYKTKKEVADRDGDREEVGMHPLSGSEKKVQIYHMLENGKEMITQLDRSGLDSGTHLKKLEKAKGLADGERFDESIALIRDTMHEMEIRIAMDSEENHRHKISTSSRYDIQAQVKVLKDKIEIASIYGVNVAYVTHWIDMALMSERNRSYKRAMDILNKGNEHVTSAMEEELILRISKYEEVLEGIKKMEKAITTEQLELVKDAWISEDFSDAFAHLSNVEEWLQERRSSWEKAWDRISSIEQVINDLESMGVGVGDYREMLDICKENAEKASVEDCLDIVVKTEEKIKDGMSMDLKMVTRDALMELQESKLSRKRGATPICILQSAISYSSKGDVLKCIAYMKKFKEEIKKPSGSGQSEKG